GPPGVLVVAPRVRAGLDRDEAVAAVVAGEAAAGAREVRVERRRVPVDLVVVAAGCIRLPDLDQRAADRPALVVEHAAGDNDPLAERVTFVLACQVVVAGPDVVLTEDRTFESVQLLGQRYERAIGCAPAGRAIAGIVELDLRPEVGVIR